MSKSFVSSNIEYKRWRHDLHKIPETAFNESKTADYIADKLKSFGLDVERGIAKTGVIGVLQSGDCRNSAKKSIGLRSDMDALPMDESSSVSYKSTHLGAMHACGHDGHMATLLAAAKYLSETKNFAGTVYFIFQPAEEANAIGSGARAMIGDGLFERFPMDSIFAMHNAPDFPLGTVATCAGSLAASMDLFDVTIKAKGAHGATPHKGIDPIVIAAQLVTAWQTIISRNINAQDSAVLSVTSINTGDSWNVIPENAHLKGSVRSLSKIAAQQIKERFVLLTRQICHAYGAEVIIDYRESFPVLLNDKEETAFACNVAADIVGESNVNRQMKAGLGSDDFAFMLAQCKGCYLVVGGGPNDTDKEVPALHSPNYDFNDALIPIGVSLFVGLVEQKLPIQTKVCG